MVKCLLPLSPHPSSLSSTDTNHSIHIQSNKSKTKMAPSVTETVTIPVLPSSIKLNPSGTGQYKELAASKFDKEAESGNKGFEAATVRHSQPLPLSHSFKLANPGT